MPTSVVIGIGNEYRSDDGVGMTIVRTLNEQSQPDDLAVSYIEAGMVDGASLIDYWSTDNRVIIIDAVSSGAQAGTLYHFDALAEQLPTSVSFGDTHGFGVTEAVMLATMLKQLPAALHVYAIEGEDFSTGLGLSPTLQEALPAIVVQIQQHLREWQH
jgi:hydrogenase maturation protease